MKYLFPNFLKNLDEFHKSQNYWVQLCQDLLRNNLYGVNWIVGTEPLEMDISSLDNFPMVGGFNLDKTKGFTVYQQDPKANLVEVSAWTSKSEKFSETRPIIYLEITCNLSEVNSEVIKKLFEKWIEPNCSRKEMDDFVECYLTENSPTNTDF